MTDSEQSDAPAPKFMGAGIMGPPIGPQPGPGQSVTREQLESDEAFMAAEAVLRGEFGEPPTEEAWCDVYGWIVDAVLAELVGEAS